MFGLPHHHEHWSIQWIFAWNMDRHHQDRQVLGPKNLACSQTREDDSTFTNWNCHLSILGLHIKVAWIRFSLQNWWQEWLSDSKNTYVLNQPSLETHMFRWWHNWSSQRSYPLHHWDFVSSDKAKATAKVASKAMKSCEKTMLLVWLLELSTFFYYNRTISVYNLFFVFENCFVTLTCI